MDVKIESSWKKALKPEFEKTYFTELVEKLKAEKETHTIFPKGADIFRAFDLTPLDQVKVIILGQDPYHGVGQAHGLSFSVPKGVKQPPSLKNIFKELQSDIGITPPQHGDLSSWAKQGVMLINAMLTVRAHEAGSHQSLGWQNFTDKVIQVISEKRENCVFILWGNYARNKVDLIDQTKHKVIQSPHPSPFSANRGFFGSKPFSITNAYLKENGQNEINWAISE